MRCALLLLLRSATGHGTHKQLPLSLAPAGQHTTGLFQLYTKRDDALIWPCHRTVWATWS